MPNKRISELDESSTLSVSQINNQENLETPTESIAENEVFFLLAKEKQSNHKISFSNLSRSINKNHADRHTDQIISGQKTFSDPCRIQKRTNISQLHGPADDSVLSGYKVISQSGFFKAAPENTFKGNFAPESGLSVTSGISAGNKTETLKNINANFCSGKNIQINQNIYSNNLQTNQLDCSDKAAFNSESAFFANINTSHPIEVNQNYKLNIKEDFIIEKDGQKVVDINNQENYIDLSGHLYLNKDNFLNSTSQSPAGAIYTYNTGYSTESFAIITGDHQKIIPAGDESVTFSQKLKSNLKEFEINLPKTFLFKPVISACVSSSKNFSNKILISSVTTNSLLLKIDEPTDEDSYVKITAMSDSKRDFSTNNQGIYRFHEPIASGKISETITYPEPFLEKPTVSTSIEGNQHVPLYIISGVNTTEYKIAFNEPTKEDYIVHTTLSTKNKQTLN